MSLLGALTEQNSPYLLHEILKPKSELSVGVAWIVPTLCWFLSKETYVKICLRQKPEAHMYAVYRLLSRLVGPGRKEVQIEVNSESKTINHMRKRSTIRESQQTQQRGG